MNRHEATRGLHGFGEYLIAYGTFLGREAELEGSTKMLERSESWQELAESLDERQREPLARVLAQLDRLGPRLREVRALPAGDKRDLGEALELLGIALRRLAAA